MKKSITAHMIVKNEDRFIWYTINSVLPYVDKFLIYDTGSSDKTVSVIQTFKDKKIIFEKKGTVDAEGLVKLRNEQIHRSATEWIWIVDGDEVYPQDTIKAIIQSVNSSNNYNGIIVHRYDLLGDIYHCQDEKVGPYNQFGKLGHYVLRLINKNNIFGLKVLGKYPNEYFADQNGMRIKDSGKDHFAIVNERIFHALYLKRSTLGGNLLTTLNRRKNKIELGKEIPTKELPQIFFANKPFHVPDVIKKRSLLYSLLAFFITPIKKIKRKISR